LSIQGCSKTSVFEETSKACPATYENRSFAVLRTRPQGEKLQEPVTKQPISEQPHYEKEYDMKIKVLLALAFLSGSGLFGQDARHFTYVVRDGTVSVTGYKGDALQVIIPGQIEGLPVTFIGAWAFQRNQLTGVTIPDSVTAIGNEAFILNELTRFSIPDSVTAIGAQAFAINQLTRLAIPDSVCTIGDRAFADNRLTHLSLPAGVDMRMSSFYILPYTHYTANDRKAAEYAFSRSREGGFDVLVSADAVEIVRYVGRRSVLRIPEKFQNLPVTAIGTGAFQHHQLDSFTIFENGFADNHYLTSVTIPDSVTVIGDRAFRNNRLRDVTIPDSVTAIGESAFAQNRSDRVTISNSITIIGTGVFEQNQLTSVTIPDSVTAIGMRAFMENQLTSVVIPDSVTLIGASAFRRTRLTSITIGADVELKQGALPGDLTNVYAETGRQAGTYTS
jgi:hypothetical protein